jgi:hypothetical protein
MILYGKTIHVSNFFRHGPPGLPAKANLARALLADAAQRDRLAKRFPPRRFPGLYLPPHLFLKAKARRADRLARTAGATRPATTSRSADK